MLSSAEREEEVPASVRDLLALLWSRSRGDARVRIALLDGVVDLAHPALAECRLRQEATTLAGRTSRHATAIASLLFGHPPGWPHSLSPECEGISLPVFADAGAFGVVSCSEPTLARAIEVAVEHGATIINVSASSPTPDGRPGAALERALRRCESAGVLVVAATGNRGRKTLSLPAAWQTVLAVGASTEDGLPAEFSSWQPGFGPHAVLAPAPRVPGFELDGTSAAAALVSGLVALLLSAQIRSGDSPQPLRVRSLLSSSSCVMGPRRGQLNAAARRALHELTRTPLASAGGAGSPDVSSTAPSLRGALPTVEALRDHYGGVLAEHFGSTEIETLAGHVYRVHDLHYTLSDGSRGMHLVPVDESSVEGSAAVDALLRRTCQLGPEAPLYALLTYARPGESRVALNGLLGTYKRRLGYPHVGAYLGGGLTTHALPARGLADWTRRGAFFAWNVRGRPAHVHVISLHGVPQSTLNQNLRLVDRSLSRRPSVPSDTERLATPFVSLRDCLAYYRDHLLGRTPLPETNCADHKYLIVNVGLNLPHHPEAFGEAFGELGSAAWRGFLGAFRELEGRAFCPQDATEFNPLWKLEGHTPALLPSDGPSPNPASKAVLLSIATGAANGLVWPPETIIDVVRAILETYVPPEVASPIMTSDTLASLEPLIAHVTQLSPERIGALLRPVHLAILESEPRSDGEGNLAACWHRARRETLVSSAQPGFFHTPAAPCRAAAGDYPTSVYVTIQTVCTVMRHDELQFTTKPHTSVALERQLVEASYLSASTEDRMNRASTSPTPPIAVPPVPLGNGTPTASASEPPCECQTQPAPESRPLVYALGRMGYDLGPAARRESLNQTAPGAFESPDKLLELLDKSPWIASSINWLLMVEGAPVYVLAPEGPFARDAYEVFRSFLKEQLHEGVERVSVPGFISGTQQLAAGYSVPTLSPEIRGMYNWTTSALVEKIVTQRSDSSSPREPVARGVTQFLERVYFELRNPGLSSQERAINFAATNAFQLDHIYEKALGAEMELDLIEVERNPLARPGSDCWDVKLTFFCPSKNVTRHVARFTIDVSDVVPTRIGDVRSWSVR